MWHFRGGGGVSKNVHHFQANFSDHPFNALHPCHLRAGSPDHPAVLGHRLLHVAAAVRLLRLLEPVHAAVLHTARSSSPGFFSGDSLVYLENMCFYFYFLSQSSTILFGMRPQLMTNTLKLTLSNGEGVGTSKITLSKGQNVESFINLITTLKVKKIRTLKVFSECQKSLCRKERRK